MVEEIIEEQSAEDIIEVSSGSKFAVSNKNSHK
jgi:hypothetical protein